MTKQKLIELNKALNTVGRLSGVSFSYAVARNIRLLAPEVEAIEKATELSKKFLEYDKARMELAAKHSKKNDKNEPIIENNQFSIENPVAFNKDFEKLQKTHKETLDEQEKQNEDFKKLLQEETNITLYKVKLENIPKEITTAELSSILDIVEE